MSLVNGKHQAAWFCIRADQKAEAEGSFAGIVFNRPIDRVFTYRGPAPASSRWLLARPAGPRPPGSGLRSRRLELLRDPSPRGCLEDVESRRLKDVLEVLDDPPLIDAAMLDLTCWLAGYYACSWGQALDAVVPAGVKKGAGTRVGTFLPRPRRGPPTARGPVRSRRSRP